MGLYSSESLDDAEAFANQARGWRDNKRPYRAKIPYDRAVEILGMFAERAHERKKKYLHNMDRCWQLLVESRTASVNYTGPDKGKIRSLHLKYMDASLNFQTAENRLTDFVETKTQVSALLVDLISERDIMLAKPEPSDDEVEIEVPGEKVPREVGVFN